MSLKPKVLSVGIKIPLLILKTNKINNWNANECLVLWVQYVIITPK